jgi:glycosyltransferase involved in cell wall biosynthesis
VQLPHSREQLTAVTKGRQPVENEILQAHRASFDRLVKVVQLRLERRQFDDAAALARLAAEFASLHHPGCFTSPELETVTRALGAVIDGETRDGDAPLLGSLPPQRVLHVFTEAYEIGGHTRLATRWIRLDSNRVHCVVTTRQRGDVPAELRAAAEASGGSVATVRDDRSLLATASRLAALADSFDAVVLHVHPSDVVPSIAFSSHRPRPPVLFVNHADHVFWLGTSVADVVVCLRQSGHLIARTRRGIDESRLLDMPIPLILSQRTMTRKDAKQALDIVPGHVVLLTVAAEYKFESRRPTGFLDLVVPVIGEQESTTLLAVGPTDSGRWHEANKLTAGRVRPLGVLPDPALHRDAADIYLDSTPFASITSLLESAALGTPCLAYVGGRDPGSPSVSDPHLVVDAILRAQNPAEYRRLLVRLISEPEFRAEVGAGLASRVREAHSTDRWLARLEEVYEQLGSVGRAEQPTAVTTAFMTTDIDREVVSLATSCHGPLAVAEIQHSIRGEFRSLKGQALFGRALLLPRALRYRTGLPVPRYRNSSIPPRWWPISDRFLVR